MASRRCPKCQQVIIGSGHLYNGKLYCDQCYTQIIEEVQQLELQKRDLFDFIKELFMIESIPDSWIYTIDQLLSSGKKISGIKMTLIYYYQILGNTPNEVYGLSVVKKYYEDAYQYALKQQEIEKLNREHQEKAEQVTVRINRPVSAKRKPDYRIEDL